MYDTVIWGNNLEENFNEVCKLLDVCCKAGLIFNLDKFQFGQDTVNFAGLKITPDGARPGKMPIESIKNFPPPTTITEARSFFRIVNQVSYIFAMSFIIEPLRHLGWVSSSGRICVNANKFIPAVATVVGGYAWQGDALQPQWKVDIYPWKWNV